MPPTVWKFSVNTTACKRLFSLGCVPHTDGAVCQHGGDMGGAKAPRTQGWPQDGVSNAQHFRYADFKLARMCPGCAPSPLACESRNAPT